MSEEILKCSFCNKNSNDVTLLIAGANAHICDDCVELSRDIVGHHRCAGTVVYLNKELATKEGE